MATIMIIDDDPEIRQLLVALVEKLGHEALAAPSATDAWNMLDKKPQAIFADIDMGQESGVTFVSRLREHPIGKRVPVTFVTAYPERAAPLIAAGVGVVDVIRKPFRIELIQVRLEQMLTMPS